TEVVASDRRLSQPPDPNWKPDVVLNEETIGFRDGEESTAAPASAAGFRLLFQRIAAGPRPVGVERSATDLNPLLKAVLMVMFMGWMVGMIWLGWVLWNESDEAGPEATLNQFHTTAGSST